MGALELRTSVDDAPLWGDLLLTLLWGDLLLTLLWGRSAADIVMRESAAGGPQVVQHSCMGTAVLHNLCGSAAVAKLQLPSSQSVQA